jgi:hypothetical protein
MGELDSEGVSGGRAHFANFLEDADNVFEVADVEDGKDEFDVGVVSDAECGLVAARFAGRRFVYGPLQ